MFFKDQFAPFRSYSQAEINDDESKSFFDANERSLQFNNHSIGAMHWKRINWKR
jgi:hypothetical protein